MWFSVLAGVALIVLVVFFAYFPSLNGGFILDDDRLLTDNPLIKASDGLYRFWCTSQTYDYWPVTNTTFWIEWRLWELNSTGYRVTNLILHIAESLLIWIILRKLSIPGAFFAAAIFAVHPVNVESVAWISQRKNMMAMLFFLLSILFYLKLEIPSPSLPGCHAHACRGHVHQSIANRWYWLSLAAFVLAMLSKGSVAVLPMLLLGIVWWLRPLTRWDWVRTAPFFVVAVALAGVNIWFQTHGSLEKIRTAGFAERLLGAGGVTWFYLYKALLPIDLLFVYPQWRIEVGNPLWWLPLLAALIVTAVLWWYRTSWSRPLLFAWGFFCAALVPVMGFTDVGFMKYSLVADHYQHIAIIGVITLAAAGMGVWIQRAPKAARRAATALAVVIVGTLTFLSWRQNGLYSDEITLYQATLQKNPSFWMGHNNLGLALVEHNRYREGIEHFQQSLLINPDYAEAHNNLGNALMESGRLQESIKYFNEAIQLKSDYPAAYNNLGNAYRSSGQYQQAFECYEKALRLNPYYAEAHYNLGLVLILTDRPQEAIEHLEQTLRLKPNFVEAYNNLGCMLMRIGRPQAAIECLQQALLLNPNFIMLYSNLALAYSQTGQPAEAIASGQKALELARSQGQAALAKQAEDWLNTYRASLSDLPNTTTPSKSDPSPH